MQSNIKVFPIGHQEFSIIRDYKAILERLKQYNHEENTWLLFDYGKWVLVNQHSRLEDIMQLRAISIQKLQEMVEKYQEYDTLKQENNIMKAEQKDKLQQEQEKNRYKFTIEQGTIDQYQYIEEIKTLKQIINDQDERFKNQSDELEKLKQNIRDQKDQGHFDTKIIEKKNSENHKLSSEVERLSSEINELKPYKEQSIEFSKGNQNLQQTIQQKDESIKNLELNEQEKNYQIQQLQYQLNQSQYALLRYQEQLRDQEQKLRDREQQLKNQEYLKNQEIQKRLEQLNQEKLKYQEQLKNQEYLKNQEIQKCLEQLNQEKLKYQELLKQEQLKNQEIQKYQEQLNQEKLKYQELLKQEYLKNQEIQKYQEQLNQEKLKYQELLKQEQLKSQQQNQLNQQNKQLNNNPKVMETQLDTEQEQEEVSDNMIQYYKDQNNQKVDDKNKNQEKFFEYLLNKRSNLTQQQIKQKNKSLCNEVSKSVQPLDIFYIFFEVQKHFQKVPQFNINYFRNILWKKQRIEKVIQEEIIDKQQNIQVMIDGQYEWFSKKNYDFNLSESEAQDIIFNYLLVQEYMKLFAQDLSKSKQSNDCQQHFQIIFPKLLLVRGSTESFSIFQEKFENADSQSYKQLQAQTSFDKYINSFCLYFYFSMNKNLAIDEFEFQKQVQQQSQEIPMKQIEIIFKSAVINTNFVHIFSVLDKGVKKFYEEKFDEGLPEGATQGFWSKTLEDFAKQNWNFVKR